MSSAANSQRIAPRQSPDRAGQATLLVAAASLLATIPVWLPTFPPMADLPQHAAQLTLLRNLSEPGFRYASIFYLNWFTPYLLGYLLVYSLVPIFGVVVACKLVISIALAALPVATALLMSETGSDRRWALLAIPAMYGFSYHWGLLNFIVAAPLGLAFLCLGLRYARRPSLGGGLAVGLAINALFFCHALICVFFAVVGACVLMLSAPSARLAIRRVLPLVSVLPVMLVWLLRAAGSAVSQRPVVWDLSWVRTIEPYYAATATWTTAGGWGWGRVLGILPRLLGAVPGLLPTLLGATLFVLPLLAGARLSRRLIALLPLLFCVVVLLFIPEVLFGVDFTFHRFTVFVLPLYLVTLQQPASGAWPRWTWPAVGLLVALWTGNVALNALRYEREAAGFDEIVAQMAPGERALSLIFERDSVASIAPTYLHFPAWYSALKGGLVDPSFAGTQVQLVLFRPGKSPAAQWLFEWNPQLYSWSAVGGEQYRYFVVRAPRDLGAWIFAAASCNGRLVHQVHEWWLYETDRGCGGR